VHSLVREVLSRADSLASAEAVIRSAPVAASSALTVVTGAGAATFEVSPQGVARLEPGPAVGTGGATRVLWHTNHFRDPALADGDAGPTTSTTYSRGMHVESRLDEVTTAGKGLQELAAAVCGPEGERAPVCLMPGNGATGPWTTLLTAGIEVEPARLALHPGTPATVPAEPELEGHPCVG
jgi:isopenicillin-N N-acyltransferase-like protein